MDTVNSLLNLAFLKKFTNDDLGKMKNYIEMYLKMAPRLFGEMEQAIGSMNNEEVYSRAHSLKPMTIYVGIVGLTDVLIQIENASKENLNMNFIKELVEKAIELNKKGMAEMVKYLET